MRYILFFLFFSSFAFTQVSVSSQHVGGLKPIKKEDFSRFKNTKTIFILSEVFTHDEYKEVLSESWTLTPYELVNKNDVNLENYDLEKTSFALLGGHIVNIQKSSGLSFNKYFTYVDFFMFDKEKKLKEIEEYKKKSNKRKENYDLLAAKRENFARFYLLPNNELLKSLFIGNISFEIYKKPSFFNYKLGFLKNYFQFINDKMTKNESYWFYQNSSTLEFKQLKSKTLYVPSYVITHLSGEDEDSKNAKLEDYFKDYEYKYELMDDDVLNKKILEGEEFYYLRYARVNTERFLQVVNSKNGNIVYANYITGMSVSLKPKHIKELSKDISKAK